MIRYGLALCLAIVVMASCSPEAAKREQEVRRWLLSEGKIKVLCTIGMIDDLVDRIGGDQVHSISLVTGQLDPHSYQLVKGDDEKFAAAQLVFYNGLGLEHGPSLRAYLERESKAINLGERLREKKPELILYYDGVPDPHVWMDVSLWSEHIEEIVQALIQLDPDHEDLFKERGETLQQDLQLVHQNILEIMDGVPSDKRYLVTSHDAFNYFARAYLANEKERKGGGWQKRFAAPEGLAPDGQLSTDNIQEILDHLSKYGIRVIFPESNVSRDSIQKIVEAGTNLGLTLHVAQCALYGDAMGAAGSGKDFYAGMMIHNAELIAKHLNHGKDDGP